MSGAGTKRVPVVCASCNGGGKIKTIDSRFEVIHEQCTVCWGKGKLTVARKPRNQN